MNKTNKLFFIRAVLVFSVLLTLVLGIADYRVEDTFSRREDAPLPGSALFSLYPEQSCTAVSAQSYQSTQYTFRLLNTIPLKSVSVRTVTPIELCPGGMPFGVKMFTEGLIVVGFSDIDAKEGSPHPASDAGLQLQDIILEIDGEPVSTPEALAQQVGAGKKEILELKIRRGEEFLRIPVTPSLSVSEKRYKLGILVRDNTAGIGTVTYIDPASGSFAGLGHGICDSQTGALLPLSRGSVAQVTISGVRKGERGVPGELKGFFSSGKTGALLGNSNAGVFGILTRLPETAAAENALPIALKEEIRDGKARILCTLDDSGVHSYEVTLRKIRNSLDLKNMEITVTDPALLEITGGIVQGMSGSPIIQDGKLVGAVTHVLVNDPTRGYGIFIENMLEAAG